MSIFKFTLHLIFSLLALWITHRAFKSDPKLRRVLSGVLVLEFVLFLVWILLGAGDGLYLAFNNFWVATATFDALFGILAFGLLLFYRKGWHEYANRAYAGALILTVVFAGIGHQNTVNPRLTVYEEKLTEGTPKDSLKILLVTDLHIGKIIGAEHIARLRKMAVKEKPDYLVFAGDMIDREVSYALRPEVFAEMKRLVAEAVPEGHTFFVLGNHEYYADTAEKLVWIKSLGTLLRDSVVKLPGEEVYFIGRDSGIGNRRRAEMSALISQVPAGAPAVIVAHEPEEYGEPEVTDRPLLVLHGHTHAGQHILFRPFLYIKAPHAYGRIPKGSATHIISSGYGVSNSTLRIGTQSEAVLICLKY